MGHRWKRCLWTGRRRTRRPWGRPRPVAHRWRPSRRRPPRRHPRQAGFGFEVDTRLSRPDGTPALGRTGTITTPHGADPAPRRSSPSAPRPRSSPCCPESMKELGAQAVLANAYHLYLQPGADIAGRGRRPGRVHELARAHVHRLRRFPGDEPGLRVQEGHRHEGSGQLRPGRRGRPRQGAPGPRGRGRRLVQVATSTATCTASPRRSPWTSSTKSARTSCSRSTSCTTLQNSRGYQEESAGAHPALGRALHHRALPADRRARGPSRTRRCSG